MPKPKKNESKQDFLKRCTSEIVSKEGKESGQAFAMCNTFWDEANGKKAERSAINLSAIIELKKVDGQDSRQFMITAYTGKVIELGWWGKFIFDLSGIETQPKFPILREHRRDRIVGTGEKVHTDGSNLYVSGKFSQNTKDAKEVLALADEGFPWQASVGITPLKIKSLKDEKESAIVNGQEVTGPIEIWSKSFVGEVSLVALGADNDTAAISLSQGSKVTVEYEAEIIQEEANMPIELKKLEAEAPDLLVEIRATAKNDGVAEGKALGIQDERSRVMEILMAEADPKVAMKAIEDGISAESAFKLFFQAEKAKRVDALKELEDQAPKALGQGVPESPSGDTFEGKVQEKLSNGEAKSRSEAIKLTVQQSPELHQAYIARVNEKGGK